jgi:hypothetical protein
LKVADGIEAVAEPTAVELTALRKLRNRELFDE